MHVSGWQVETVEGGGVALGVQKHNCGQVWKSIAAEQSKKAQSEGSAIPVEQL